MEELEPPLVSDRAFDWPDRPLAEGGMAVIYEARDRRLPRTVILKSPRTRRRGGGELAEEERVAFVERLSAEANVLARLQHPSIVTIHEVGKADDGLPFCVLEKVEGKPLIDVLDEIAAAEAQSGEKHMVERIQLVSDLVAIAEALACAHERGIVHRDVTPNNILVGPRGEMTLIDWGIASDQLSSKNLTLAIDRSLDEVPPDSRFVTIGAGTPPYVSLEQTQGMAAQPSFDIYSFGATLYHVVAGRPPFKYESVTEFLELLDQRKLAPPASPHDRDLSAIIALAMSPDPSARPSAAELIEQLRAYLTGELVFAQRYSLSGRLSRWVRRQPIAAAAIVLAVVASVAAVMVWTITEERAQNAAREAAEVQAAAEAKAAAPEREAARKAIAQAEAERQRADAVMARQKAEELARDKEAEARRALAEAEAAKGDSARYKELKEKADAAAAAADDARRTADESLKLAEDAARAAAEQASKAAEAAQSSQKEADAATAKAAAMARERDEAIGQRDAAEQARDEAVAQRNDAESARSAAEKARDEAVAQRNQTEEELTAARARIAELEKALEEERRKPPPAPEPEPGPPAPEP
jgi:tRNA A-37 threonylcarbamoyl transferase component Bud32